MSSENFLGSEAGCRNPSRAARRTAGQSDPCVMVIFGAGGDLTRTGGAAQGWLAVTSVVMPPRTFQRVCTVMRRGLMAATRSSRMRLVMSSWNAPSSR